MKFIKIVTILLLTLVTAASGAEDLSWSDSEQGLSTAVQLLRENQQATQVIVYLKNDSEAINSIGTQPSCFVLALQ